MQSIRSAVTAVFPTYRAPAQRLMSCPECSRIDIPSHRSVRRIGHTSIFVTTMRRMPRASNPEYHYAAVDLGRHAKDF